MDIKPALCVTIGALVGAGTYVGPGAALASTWKNKENQAENSLACRMMAVRETNAKRLCLQTRSEPGDELRECPFPDVNNNTYVLAISSCRKETFQARKLQNGFISYLGLGTGLAYLAGFLAHKAAKSALPKKIEVPLERNLDPHQGFETSDIEMPS